jgi:endonuclease/exonuclease/phosphatase family metal-dependent hydrolase
MSIIRLLCFNIHGGYDLKGRRDLRRVHELMDTLDIDIGVFQEMETRPSYGGTEEDIDILAGLSRSYHLPGPTLKEGEGWYGNLIISRFPIIRAQVHNLETIKVLEPRNAVDALIETPHGKIRIIGTHLSLSSLVRWFEIRNLIKLVDEVEEEAKNPVLFMGDINEWRWPSKLLRHLDNLMTPIPSGKTFPAFLPLFRLDRVWCGEPALDVTAQTLTGPHARYLSDHLPVLIEIRGLEKISSQKSKESL